MPYQLRPLTGQNGVRSTPYLHVAYFNSLITTAQALCEHGIDCSFSIESGNSLLPAARNCLASRFLANREAMHLLMADGDISWDPTAVLRLLAHDVDMCCGLYRTKNPTGSFDFLALEPEAALGATGLVEIAGAPGGFTMVRREVLTRLIAAGLAPPITGSVGNYASRAGEPGNAVGQWDFFAMARAADGSYWSEDFAFSQRWRSIGGRIFADVAIRLGHHGDHAYRGDPLSLFRAPASERHEDAPSTPHRHSRP